MSAVEAEMTTGGKPGGGKGIKEAAVVVGFDCGPRETEVPLSECLIMIDASGSTASVCDLSRVAKVEAVVVGSPDFVMQSDPAVQSQSSMPAKAGCPSETRVIVDVTVLVDGEIGRR